MLKKILLLTAILLLSACSQQQPLQVVPGAYPKVEKAKWQGNYAATLEDILREMDERRSIEKGFN